MIDTKMNDKEVVEEEKRCAELPLPVVQPLEVNAVLKSSSWVDYPPVP